MDPMTVFLTYATIFRLAVIAAGTVSIILGYYLFVHGLRSEGNTNATGKVGDFTLTLKNVAPGTCFALFGAVIISVIVVQGSPEFAIQELQRMGGLNAPEVIGKTTFLKGSRGAKSAGDYETFELLIEQANRYNRKGNRDEAIAAYMNALAIPEVTLARAAQAFNELAWAYEKRGKSSEALPLARLAVNVDPQTSAFRDTLALVLLKLGESKEAMEHAHQAVTLSRRPEHLHTLSLSYQALGDFQHAFDAMKEAAEMDPSYMDELASVRAQLR